jgi:hypothetical protein
MAFQLHHFNLSNAKPSKVNRLMYWDSVSHTLARISNQRSTINRLRVASVRGVLVRRRLRDAQNVGPLLQSLGIVGVGERGVSSSVPAASIISPVTQTPRAKWGEPTSTFWGTTQCILGSSCGPDHPTPGPT